MKDTEKLLNEADRERREVREKYIALSRKMESLQSNEEAARYGLQARHCTSVLHSCTQMAGMGVKACDVEGFTGSQNYLV